MKAGQGVAPAVAAPFAAPRLRNADQLVDRRGAFAGAALRQA